MDLACNNRQAQKPNAAAPAKAIADPFRSVPVLHLTSEAVKGRQTPHSSGIHPAFLISIFTKPVGDHVGKLGQPLPTDRSIPVANQAVKKMQSCPCVYFVTFVT